MQCYALFHHGPGYTSITKAPLWKHLSFTLPLFAANVTMGLFIENLGIVMSISGSLSAVIIAFVLPPMCYLRQCEYQILFWREKDAFSKWSAFKTTAPPFLVCLSGILIAIFSTGYTIMQHYGLKFDWYLRLIDLISICLECLLFVRENVQFCDRLNPSDPIQMRECGVNRVISMMRSCALLLSC